jgi:sialate O-acetylesterase
MRYSSLVWLSCLGSALSLSPTSFSNVFGSNMVLQRGSSIPVWGWGTPGDALKVSFTGLANQSTVVDPTGFWRVVFPPQPASTAPRQLVACGLPSGSCAALLNVLLGDVVLCSGQSNTEYNVASSFNASAEEAAADLFPLLRVTSGPLQGQFNLHTLPIGVPSPQLLAVDLPWSVANHSNIGGNGKGWDYYSAVCWFYLRDTFLLNQAAGETVPLGGVVQCYGGTSIQWWSSADALAACPLAASNPGSSCCNYGGNASCLYNAQIHPYTLGPMQFSAVFWYQ